MLLIFCGEGEANNPTLTGVISDVSNQWEPPRFQKVRQLLKEKNPHPHRLPNGACDRQGSEVSPISKSYEVSLKLR